MTSPYELPKRRRIFLMRHGDVTYFDATGRAIDPESVPLNERGREEASAAGREFAAQHIHFDKVIASGLPRTLETARRVLAETGRNVEIEVWPEWQEIRGGRLSGLPDADFERAFLSVFDGIVPESTAFLGGETIGELLDRVLPPLQRLRDDASWDTVLLVLHGGVNRALLSHAITSGGRTFFGHLSQTTGCINALDVGAAPGDWVIRALNHSPPSPLHAGVRNTTMELLYEQFVRFKSQLK
jgi:broad specificity phosphatase PhoE